MKVNITVIFFPNKAYYLGVKFELPLSGRNLSRRVSKDSIFTDTLAGLEIPKDNQEKEESHTENESRANGKSAKNQTPIKGSSKPVKLFDSPGEEENDNAIDHDEWLKDIGISPRSTLGFGRQ